MRTIFVSSTFADMQKERDCLRDTVSAKINAIARQYNDHIEFCDLRWGINTEEMETESASRKVLEVCLEEIDRSNPPMIILLGDRYGWIPNESSVVSVANRKKLMLDDLRKSATALEAEYGTLSKRRNTIVYLREIIAQEQTIPGIYQAEDQEHRILLNDLKKRLKALPNCTVKTYTVRFENGRPRDEDMVCFSEMVADDLQRVFQPYWEQFASMTEFERERERQWTFIQEKSAMFSARKADLDALMAEINGNRQSVVCKGPSGSGKSTLASRLAVRARDEGWEVLPFIGGLTDESNDAMDVLRNTIYYMEGQLQLEHFSKLTAKSISEFNPNSIPSLTEWQNRLRDLAKEYDKAGRKLLVVVDAVDQLFPDEIRDSCGFIPPGISKSITYCMTALPDIDLPEKSFYALRPLAEEDREQVVAGVLHRFGRELSPRVRKHLLGMVSTDNPYYISMAVQRLCMMEGVDFEEANTSSASPAVALGDRQIAILDSCPDTIEEMCVELFSEAARRIDAELLNTATNFIAVSRYGLRRSDLSALLGEAWSELKFAHFMNYLYEDFQIRTDGRIDFMHKTIRLGLRRRLKDDRSYDRRVAAYLGTLNPYEPIRMDEMPYHLMRGEDHDSFVSYICQYELGKKADPEVIRRAALTVKDVCLKDGIDYMKDVIKITSEKDNQDWVSLLWFVIKELNDAFGEQFQERHLKAHLLTASKNALESLALEGRITDRNKEIFWDRLSDQIILVYKTVNDPQLLEWAGDTKLEIAKKKYSGNDLNQRRILFSQYYYVLIAYKSVADTRMLQKGVMIAEEGAELLDDALIEAISDNSGSYFGCMGEMYSRLKKYDKCLKAYQRDLEFRKRVHGSDPDNPLALLYISGGYGNVATAHTFYNEPSHAVAAYEAACMEISYLEKAEAKTGKAIFSHGGSTGYSYYRAGQLFFIMKASNNSSGANVVIPKEEVENAIRWIIKGCDLQKREYQEYGDPESANLARECFVALSRMTIPADLNEEIIKSFQTWIAAEENIASTSGEPLMYYELSRTCDAAAAVIVHSSMRAYYEFALKCCEKEVTVAEEIANQPGWDNKIVRAVLSDAYFRKCEVLFNMNPGDGYAV